MPRPHGGQRPDDGVDPLVPLEPRDGEQPRAAIESVRRARRTGIEARTEALGAGPQRDDLDASREVGPAEAVVDRARQLARPAAVGDDDCGAPEQRAARPAFEAAAADLGVEQQQLRAVDHYAVGDATAPRQPARRIAGGLELGAPREARRELARELTRAPRPQRQPVQGAQARRADAGAIHQLGVAGVARGVVRGAPRGDDQRLRRVAPRELAHHAGDAAAQGGEVESQKEGSVQTGWGMRDA